MMDYFTELLESYDLLKKRKLKIRPLAEQTDAELAANAAAQAGAMRDSNSQYQPPEAPGTRVWKAQNGIVVAGNRQFGMLRILNPEGGIYDQENWDAFVSLFGGDDEVEGQPVEGEVEGQPVEGEEGLMIDPAQQQAQDMVMAYPDRGEDILRSLDKVCKEMSILTRGGFFTDADEFVMDGEFDPAFCMGPKGSLASILLNRKTLGLNLTENSGSLIKREDVNDGKIVRSLDGLVESLRKISKLQTDHTNFTETDALTVKNNLRFDTRGARGRVFLRDSVEDSFGISFDWQDTRTGSALTTIAERYNEKLKNIGLVDSKFNLEANLQPNYSFSQGYLNNVMKESSERLGVAMAFLVRGNTTSAARMLLELQQEFGEALDEAYRVSEAVANAEEIATEQTEELSQWLNDFQQLLSEEFSEVTNEAKDGMVAIFRRVAQLSAGYFAVLGSDAAVRVGGKTGKGRKGDISLWYGDQGAALNGLSRVGVGDPNSKITTQSVRKAVLASLPEDQVVAEGNIQQALDKLNNNNGTTFSLEDEVHTVNLSLKSYFKEGARRFGQTGSFVETTAKINKELADPNSWASEAFGAVGANTPGVRRLVESMDTLVNSVNTMVTKNISAPGVTPEQVRRRVLDGVSKYFEKGADYEDLIAKKSFDKYVKDIIKNDKYRNREKEVISTYIINKLAPSFLHKHSSTEEGRRLIGGLKYFNEASSDNAIGMDISLLDRASYMADNDEVLKNIIEEFISGGRDIELTGRNRQSLKISGDGSISFQRDGKSSSMGGYNELNEAEKLRPVRSPEQTTQMGEQITEFLNNQERILEAILTKLR